MSEFIQFLERVKTYSFGKWTLRSSKVINLVLERTIVLIRFATSTGDYYILRKVF